VLIARGQLDDADGEIKSALAEAQQRHRQAHPDTAFALTVQAELMMARNDPQHAALLAAQAVTMYDSLNDRHSAKAIRASLLYGAILQTLDRNGEAAQQLQSALAAARDITPQASALIALAEAQLARVDTTLGDQAAAERLHAGALLLLNAVPHGDADRDAAMRLLAGTQTAALN